MISLRRSLHRQDREKKGYRALGVACLALLLILAASLMHAQQITGTIVGTVNDPQGAVISGAIVKATNTATAFSRVVTANGYGQYRIDYLPVGTYMLEVDANGFKRYLQQNIALLVDQTQTVSVTLAIGAQSQTVTVTEAPPTVDTSTAVLGRTIDPAEIIGLPLVNRNAYAQLSLTPGVQANSASPSSNPNGTPNFVIGLPSAAVQINGSIDGGNPEVSFYLDGGSNITGIRNYGNQLPNPDAIEEFRVETSNFSAQYGHISSAVITAVTKSGTNRFHGSLFEFNRNTDFNATPWNSMSKAPYHRNNFGGVIGGPIKRDRTFFLFSYAGLRQVVGQQLTGGVMPTAAERLGDFTADSFKVYAPGTKAQVAGTNTAPNCQSAKPNCIPQSLLDATAANILNTSKLIPLPNSSGNTYVGFFTGPTQDDEYLGKYDQSIGDNDHVSVTYFFVRTTQNAFGNGPIPWDINQSFTDQTNANVSEVHTFSASTANQAWLTFTRAAGGRVNLESMQSSTARNGKSKHRPASSATAPRAVLKRPKKLQSSSATNGTARSEHDDPYQLQGLDRVVAILDLLGASDNSLSLAEICQRMGLHKSTAHRALMALERTGMIERAPASRYRLGLKLYDMGSRVVEQIDLRSRVHPHLRKLALRVGETVHLGVLHKTRVVYRWQKLSRKFSSPDLLRRRLRLPTSFSKHWSGCGVADTPSTTKRWKPERVV